MGAFSLWGKPKRVNIGHKVICECRSSFTTGLAKQMVHGKVWKVGEAAGIIDPITGSGILPAMLSALLLVKHWDNPRAYEKSVWQRFGYMGNILSALFHNEIRGVPIKPIGLLRALLEKR